jgi:ubiquinone/menaquinone biosynthesis C-methylase UbiE
MTKTLVQEQFGATAKLYVDSKPHAKGASLERLVTLVMPQRDWHVLDVATGAGHAAYAFAPHVARVWATDITDEMLSIVREEIGKRGLSNMRSAYAKAEALPFEDGTFNLVTCRIAPHHFESIPKFLDETRRVLKPGGIFALVDNVVPPGSVGDYVNAFERFRDPSHLRSWTMPEWREALGSHGLAIEHEEEIGKEMDFDWWVQRHDKVKQQLIRSMLIEITPAVRAVLAPAENNGALTFQLCEGVFIARRT